jgi:hypothetical protein
VRPYLRHISCALERKEERARESVGVHVCLQKHCVR